MTSGRGTAGSSATPRRLIQAMVRPSGLPPVENAVERDAGLPDQIAEERTVRLVATGALGHADELDPAWDARPREEVVVNVGHDREPLPLADAGERRLHVGIKRKAREGVEIALDEGWVAVQAVLGEGLLKGQRADNSVAAIRLPMMGNVAMLPELPEAAHVEVAPAALVEDRLKGRVGPVADADQCPEHIEGDPCRVIARLGLPARRRNVRLVHRTATPSISNRQPGGGGMTGADR